MSDGPGKDYTIVQAHAGFYVISCFFENGVLDEDVEKREVIAWRIPHDFGPGWGWPEPITVDDCKASNVFWAIMSPSGRIDVQEESAFSSIEDWKEWLRREKAWVMKKDAGLQG